MIHIINTMLCVVIAMCLFLAGYEWQINGYGLNPLISLPLATIFMFLPLVLPMLIAYLDSKRDKVEHCENDSVIDY